MDREIVPHINKIMAMVEEAKRNALQSVNAELIRLYGDDGGE